MQFRTIFTLIIILIVAVVAIIFLITGMGPGTQSAGELSETGTGATGEATSQVNCFINPDDPACT